MVEKVRKRDGSVVPFDAHKVEGAIWKAAISVGGKDKEKASTIAKKVVKEIEKRFDGKIPSVEDVQDIVEKVLIEEGHAATAKAYILYRQRKALQRDMKKILGVQDDLKLSMNSIQVLQRRYLVKDELGNVKETPSQLFRRVARYIASAETRFGGDEEAVKSYENAFYEIMTGFEFLPNSPTLMNAGTNIGQLSACFILGIGDSLEDIFDSIKYSALIHQSGGGTGFCFSHLRPKGDFVKSTAGVASGPISFMTVFDHATNVIKQGGKRRGANMGVLHVWHPDIEDFISVKQTMGVLENFNISVGVDDAFMKAVEHNEEYALINPRTKEPARRINARGLFKLIAYSAWKSAEPGVLFMDTINRANPTPKYTINATNPCGEVPMPDFESCNLGSINLSKFVELDWSKGDWKKKVKWDRLRYVVRLAIQFLDNVVELNNYPLPQIREMSLRHRRVGLGVMGFSRMLFKIGIKYDGPKGLEAGEEIMKFITTEARKMSHELGRARGSFPEFANSTWAKEYDAMRNATVTSIAPTGTISMIAETSSGIEPAFALAYIKNVMDGTKLFYSDDVFEQVLKVRGLYSAEIMKKIITRGSLKEIGEIPQDIKDIFVISYDISTEGHIRMQAAFQKWTDLAVSKTINMPSTASVEDVENAYMLAWKLGCKGVTVYRDKSRGEQVLSVPAEGAENRENKEA
ncbi:MAG: adenosylcobalamin-dependent ribonucleoside-diphosphate reductase [Candidatus ainarchaeum sp.]|nr:adenosylcobalamin-dependent ribonucleoside-diphosphate reductase [Candidatus ainarchaeum sp.]MDD5096650.1 adenosylcobalamin-dependent ribonucleoside-diphosphate reductase [Candidatus ainarchaeum sp.]